MVVALLIAYVATYRRVLFNMDMYHFIGGIVWELRNDIIEVFQENHTSTKLRGSLVSMNNQYSILAISQILTCTGATYQPLDNLDFKYHCIASYIDVKFPYHVATKHFSLVMILYVLPAQRKLSTLWLCVGELDEACIWQLFYEIFLQSLVVIFGLFVKL